MNKFKLWLSKTSTQIAVVVSLMCLGLFLLLNFAVLKNSENSFETVVGGIQLERIPNSVSELPGYHIYSAYPLTLNQKIEPANRLDIVKFYLDDDDPKSLTDLFVDQFQRSIFWVSILAVGVSFGIGLLASKVYTTPLAHLSQGMTKLRENDYKFKLESTGTMEFDQVIDEFNRLTDELQKVEVLRKDLIADTSHELKTPIASLMGQLEGVRDGVLPFDEDRVKVLMDQVRRLDDLVERLQEFSRIRNKNQNLQKVDIKLRELIGRVVSVQQLSLDEHGIHVNVNVEENMIVKGSEILIEQIFNNLMSNAIAYSMAESITISSGDNMIVFADDGVGIPEEHLPYVFERFYRVEKSRNRQSGGLGLGLAIVKEIVEAHGWTISARNNHPRGLRYEISLISAAE